MKNLNVIEFIFISFCNSDENLSEMDLKKIQRDLDKLISFR